MFKYTFCTLSLAAGDNYNDDLQEEQIFEINEHHDRLLQQEVKFKGKPVFLIEH